MDLHKFETRIIKFTDIVIALKQPSKKKSCYISSEVRSFKDLIQFYSVLVNAFKWKSIQMMICNFIWNCFNIIVNLCKFICCFFFQVNTCQVRLKIWTEHFTLISLNHKMFELFYQKFLHFYHYGRYEISPNLDGVPQKLGLPCPFEVLNTYSKKLSIEHRWPWFFWTKWVFIEVSN